MKILLGVTGSVAAKLTAKILKKLLEAGHEVQIVATKSSFYFWNESAVNVKVWKDENEWPGNLYDPDIPIAHIELREWADALLIAPITANTLAKMANGYADNLLTCVTRAWDIKKPIVIAPAMNTHMWNHPATDEHIKKLKEWYDLSIVNPVSKKLACGETGIGALADINDIVAAVKNIKHKVFSNIIESSSIHKEIYSVYEEVGKEIELMDKEWAVYIKDTQANDDGMTYDEARDMNDLVMLTEQTDRHEKLYKNYSELKNKLKNLQGSALEKLKRLANI